MRGWLWAEFHATFIGALMGQEKQYRMMYALVARGWWTGQR